MLQGEREMAKDNRSLGKFHLDGIPAAPRGVPQVEVTFDIDANGILHVSAKDKGTGKEQKITITDNTGLNDSEIENMVKDAEANAETDKQRREAIDARNQLDSLIYNTEKTIRDNKEKLAEEDIKAAEEAVAEAKKSLEGEEPDVEQIKAQIEALTQASHTLAQKMYTQTDASGGESGEGGGPESGEGGDGDSSGKTDEDVVDAEFEDVSKEK